MKSRVPPESVSFALKIAIDVNWYYPTQLSCNRIGSSVSASATSLLSNKIKIAYFEIAYFEIVYPPHLID